MWSRAVTQLSSAQTPDSHHQEVQSNDCVSYSSLGVVFYAAVVIWNNEIFLDEHVDTLEIILIKEYYGSSGFLCEDL